MDDVEAHVARPGLTHDRVEVGAVVVEQAADLVDQRGDLGDVAIEDPEGVRVGQHQAGDVLVDLRTQILDVDATVLVSCDLDHLVAGHRDRSRIGAVGGVRGQDLARAAAAVGVVGPGQQQSGQLALGAGRRLEAHMGQAADLRKRSLKQVHQLECALGVLGFSRRMQPRVAGKRRNPLVEARVVLHGAGAERVKAGVEVEVAPRQAVVVTDDLGLRHFRQLGRSLTQKVRRDQLIDRGLFDPGFGQLSRAPTRDGLLVDRLRPFGLLGSLGEHRCPAHEASLSGTGARAAALACRREQSHSMSATLLCSVRATRKQSSYSG